MQTTSKTHEFRSLIPTTLEIITRFHEKQAAQEYPANGNRGNGGGEADADLKKYLAMTQQPPPPPPKTNPDSE